MNQFIRFLQHLDFKQQKLIWFLDSKQYNKMGLNDVNKQKIEGQVEFKNNISVALSLMLIHVGKTITNHSPEHHFYRYK
jgi:uncharacterized protein (DUF2461 family)